MRPPAAGILNRLGQPDVFGDDGLGFAVVYYVVFRFAIARFDLKTPGREREEEHEDVTKA
ncbi:hypothetical protein ABZ464_36805 [Streptomyces sp. NPDC005820]|uniref:hypothetical protein n=1 Tax=Streptomyces sp. NPDC005820 TaxID=3157069 RepID=UPI0033D9034F